MPSARDTGSRAPSKSATWGGRVGKRGRPFCPKLSQLHCWLQAGFVMPISMGFVQPFHAAASIFFICHCCSHSGGMLPVPSARDTGSRAPSPNPMWLEQVSWRHLSHPNFARSTDRMAHAKQLLPIRLVPLAGFEL